MKLFGKGGKFNIIDIIVVVILIAAIVFAVVHFTSKSDDEAIDATLGREELEQLPHIRFTVYFEKIPSDLAESVTASLEGDDIMVDGAAVSPTRISNNRKLVPAEAMSWETSACESAGRVDFRITVEGRAEDMGKFYRLGTQELRLGKDYIFKTLATELTGVITQMEVLSE